MCHIFHGYGKSPDPKPSLPGHRRSAAMPLSVTQRRAAVRQLVAEQHGRPDDKRLEGPQVRKKAPEAGPGVGGKMGFSMFFPNKVLLWSLAQIGSGAIRCSFNTRFRTRFRRVPVQIPCEVPEVSGAGTRWFRGVAVQILG